MKLKMISVLSVICAGSMCVFSCGSNNKDMDCTGAFDAYSACVTTATATLESTLKTTMDAEFKTLMESAKTSCEDQNKKKDEISEDDWAKAVKLTDCLKGLSDCTSDNLNTKVQACSN